MIFENTEEVNEIVKIEEDTTENSEGQIDFQKLINEKDLIIKQLINLIEKQSVLKAYIEADPIIKEIVEMFKLCGDYIHQPTFKNYMTYGIEIEGINRRKENLVTTRTVDSKLEELKMLGLIKFEKKGYFIKSMDKLKTFLEREEALVADPNKDIYKIKARVKKTVPDTKELRYKTEARILRNFTGAQNIKKEKEKLEEKHRKISRIANNIFSIERKNETKEQLLKRIRNSIFDGGYALLESNITILIHEDVQITTKDIIDELNTNRDRKRLPNVPQKNIQGGIMARKVKFLTKETTKEGKNYNRN